MTLGLVLGSLAPTQAVDSYYITGRTIDADGVGVNGLSVQAFLADGSSSESVASDITYADPVTGDGSGFYRLVVPPGSYLVKVSGLNDNPPYQTASTVVVRVRR